MEIINNNSINEECEDNIIEANNQIEINKMIKSQPFKKAIESTILSMKKLFQSGKQL